MNVITNYAKVFDTLVNGLAKYIWDNKIEALILGISGGIDSTVCAAICAEACAITEIPLIGRSLPTNNNKNQEIEISELVGKNFCNDFKVIPIDKLYVSTMLHLDTNKEYLSSYQDDNYKVKVANGNIQARLRMIHLYHLASIHKGLVIDTDNLTEHYLGYWTIHGDVGDFKPIGDLWKTEVFELAKWLVEYYRKKAMLESRMSLPSPIIHKSIAIEKSLSLAPTAGLGITNNDLEELGAESYEQVDNILQEIIIWRHLHRFKHPSLEEEKEAFLNEQQMLIYPFSVIKNITNKHFGSNFKRKDIPVILRHNYASSTENTR